MIKFGTSGFRGIFAENFTKENIQKIGYALIKYFKNQLKNPIYVGYDNRFMGEYFAKWIAEVFASSGAKVMFYNKSVPSTLIAYQTKNLNFGVHITASHNPYFYNGIKIFIKNGRESTSEINNKLSQIANKISYAKIKTQNFDKAIENGNIIICEDIKPYCNNIVEIVDKKVIKTQKIKVLFNAMHGSSAECMKYILDKIKVDYEIMNENVDPFFENMLPAPYEENLKTQIAEMKKGDFDFGFAFDGDGDRVSFLSGDGTFYNCNYISAVIYDYFLKHKKIKGDFVKNCALTELISKIAKKYDQKVFEAEVGFKNIAKTMVENPSVIMGAESNGIALKDHIMHKDGLLFASIMIEIIAKTNKSIKELVKSIKSEFDFPCEVLEFSYPISEEKKQEIAKKVFIKKELPQTPKQILGVSYKDGCKLIFENGYWGVIRFSGNENVIRLFAEMKNKQECEEYIKIYENFLDIKIRQ